MPGMPGPGNVKRSSWASFLVCPRESHTVLLGGLMHHRAFPPIRSTPCLMTSMSFSSVYHPSEDENGSPKTRGTERPRPAREIQASKEKKKANKQTTPKGIDTSTTNKQTTRQGITSQRTNHLECKLSLRNHDASTKPKRWILWHSIGLLLCVDELLCISIHDVSVVVVSRVPYYWCPF